MPLAAYQDLIVDLIRDRSDVITPTQRDQALAIAVARYSDHRPRELVVDITSAGGARLNLPVDWQAGRSRALRIEYPIGSQPITYIEPGDFRLYQAVSGSQIALERMRLSAGEQVRLTYTRGHTLDGSTDTIPDADMHAVASLAASVLCGQLARYYAQESESSINADVVDRKTKAETYRSFERDLRVQFERHLGIDTSKAVAAGVVVAPSQPHERTRLLRGRRP